MTSETVAIGRKVGHWKLLTTAMVILVMASPAWAELGGNVSTVRDDQEHMKGTQRVTTQADYSVHEIQAASGTTVREFVSPSGTVFGVAWQGPWKPDMRQLLGAYFDQYVRALQATRARRGAVSIREPGLVVESTGHMRGFSGRAYVPQMVPSNVDPSAIK